MWQEAEENLGGTGVMGFGESNPRGTSLKVGRYEEEPKKRHGTKVPTTTQSSARLKPCFDVPREGCKSGLVSVLHGALLLAWLTPYTQ